MKVLGAILIIIGGILIGRGINQRSDYAFAMDSSLRMIEATRGVERYGGRGGTEYGSSSDQIVRRLDSKDRWQRYFLMMFGGGGASCLAGVSMIFRHKIKKAWAKGEPQDHSEVWRSADQQARRGRIFECPDCGGTVSKSAAACPHCGCIDFR